MTADAIFDIVLALMFAEASEKDDYPGFLPILNLFLQETYELNNGLRRRRGAEALSAAPTVQELDQELTYEEEIVCLLLPYGIAGRLAVQENPSLGANYVNKYEFERENLALRSAEEGIVDTYG